MPTPLRRREKVFGPGRAVPLDRNAKAHLVDAGDRCGLRRHRHFDCAVMLHETKVGLGKAALADVGKRQRVVGVRGDHNA